jgi:cytoskeletal protein CcmA (bactofilin family)
MAFLRGRNEEEGTQTMASMPSAPGPGSSPAPASNPIPMAPGRPSPSSFSAFIDQGSEFEGKLTFKDTVRIDGCFRGEVSSQNTLVVGETGEIMATVRSRCVMVMGTVTGDIYAADRLVLHKTARVEGDVEAGSIAIEEGAVLNGKITMTGSGAQRRGFEDVGSTSEE